MTGPNHLPSRASIYSKHSDFNHRHAPVLHQNRALSLHLVGVQSHRPYPQHPLPVTPFSTSSYSSFKTQLKYSFICKNSPHLHWSAATSGLSQCFVLPHYLLGLGLFQSGSISLTREGLLKCRSSGQLLSGSAAKPSTGPDTEAVFSAC